MKLVHYKKRKVLLPESWQELTGRQYVRVIQLLHKPIKNEWFSADAMLRVLTNKNIFAHYLLPADMRWRCYEHINWVYQKQNVTEQLLPVYRGLYAPAGEFNNLKLIEFHFTEILYQDYVLSKGENVDSLNKLVAALYRSPKNRKSYDYKRDPDGDHRQPFNGNELPFYVRQVRRWPLAVRQAVFVWYDACREQLFKDYREAFTGKAKKNNYAQGLFEMMRSIAGGKYGVFKDVEQLYVHTAFLEIVACRREAKELEKQSKQKA
jgi:hypothetical protein